VFTSGAKKYADRNWEKGMDWTKGVLGSLERHLADWKSGKDIDPEDGKLLISKVAWGALALTEFYMRYPEGDTRPQPWQNMPKIGLDVDEVIAGFCVAFSEWDHKSGNKYPAQPKAWNYGWRLYDDLLALKDNRDFWMGIKPIVNPNDLPFEPKVYVTSRVCSNEITEEWLEINRFPCTKVITVGHNDSKLEAVKRQNVDWFVDDKFQTFEELNSAGQFCFLFDRMHNQRYDVGHRRLRDLTKIFSAERIGSHVTDDWYFREDEPHLQMYGGQEYFNEVNNVLDLMIRGTDPDGRKPGDNGE
jgi:hypothetical protein